MLCRQPQGDACHMTSQEFPDDEIDFALALSRPTSKQRDFAFRMVSWLYERNHPMADAYNDDVEQCHDRKGMSRLIAAMRADMGLED